jgi:hypothetical protein
VFPLPVAGLLAALTLTAPPLPRQSAPVGASAQAPVSGIVRGLVIDAQRGAPIMDVRVVLTAEDGARGGDRARTAQTVDTGRFEFSNLPPGAYTLSISTVGYIFVRRRVDVVSGLPVDLTLPLAEGTGTYAETVNVGADAARQPDLGAMTTSELGSSALQDLRGVATDDPMRAAQALPGVVTGDDFQAEFSVRGSAFRHVGLVIDGTAAPILVHAVRAEANTGSIAMVNTDVIGRALLTSGPRAARHGDWIGATLEFDLRDGSRDRTMARAAVSGTSASFVVEGPTDRPRRGSWLVSLRKSYLDWLVRKVEPDFDSTIAFWDGHAKVSYDLTPRQQVSLTLVGGDAVYREREASATNGLIRAASGSTLASLSWRYATNRWVFSQRASFLGNEFKNTGVSGQELARGYTQAFVWRGDVIGPIGRGWMLEAGGMRERQRSNQILRDYAVTAGQLRVRNQVQDSPRTSLHSGWVQAGRRTAAGSITAGLRVSTRTLATGAGVSPWVMVERRAGPLTLRAGVAGAAQYTDPLLTRLSGEVIRPERARSGELGIAHRVSRSIEWYASAFYRGESDVLRLASENRLHPTLGTRIVALPFPLFTGSLEGTTRGVDLVVSRRAPGGLTGWAAYTWAHTEMRDARAGERFDADFDQRHTLNLVASQRLSYRFSVGAKLRIGSNTPLVGYFEESGEITRLSRERNRLRLPTYARLDLRLTRTFTFDRRRMTLFVEVMNVLDRENIGQADASVRASTLEVTGFAERLFPRVPSAGLLIEF